MPPAGVVSVPRQTSGLRSPASAHPYGGYCDFVMEVTAISRIVGAGRASLLRAAPVSEQQLRSDLKHRTIFSEQAAKGLSDGDVWHKVCTATGRQRCLRGIRPIPRPI